MPCKYSDILVSPQELQFETQEGSSYVPPYQYLYLKRASHDLAPRWSVIADAQWVSFRPSHGEAPEEVRVGVNLGLAVGIYHAHLTFSSPSGVRILPSSIVSITLEVKVPPPEPPPEPPPPEPPPEPPPPEPPPPEPPEPPPPPPEENWFVRFLKWLRDLFGGV